jgi:hypothetical protein
MKVDYTVDVATTWQRATIWASINDRNPEVLSLASIRHLLESGQFSFEKSGPFWIPNYCEVPLQDI